MNEVSRLRLIIDNYDNPIWLINDRLEVIDCNIKFKKIFYAVFKKNIEVGDHLLEAIDDQSEVLFWEKHIHQAIADGYSKFNYFTVVKGEKQVFEIKTFSTSATDGFLVTIYANNITEKVNFENKLEHQNAELKKINQELDNLVYSVSHQIRSPLTSLLGLINIAKIDTVENIHEYLDMMHSSILSLDNTVHEINDYSKNTRLSIFKEQINFDEICSEVLKDLGHEKNLNTIKIEKNITKNYTFFSDKDRIKVILNNILSNSIKFNDLEKQNPTIKIDIAINEDIADISISDNGEGMDQKVLPKIFDMFFRASETTRGAGLGLYVVREIINKLNGNIDVKSELHKGTIFKIGIPNMIKNEKEADSTIA